MVHKDGECCSPSEASTSRKLELRLTERLIQHGRLGLHVCLEPSNPLVDIVILHGFNSSIQQAFTHENGSNWVFEKPYWGQLAEKSRVMTFAYNANAFNDVVTARIADHAGNLLENLRYYRRSCKARPLIFIAHSMGGLVVKRALIKAKISDKRYGDILEAACAIIFIATPHLGAGKTGFIGLAQRIHAWSKLRSSSHVALSQELATFSQTIDDINRSFQPADLDIDIIDIYELEETRLPHGSELIVEPASAISSYHNERHISSAATHRDICQFGSPSDVRFVDLWRQIDECVEKGIAKATRINDQAVLDEEKPSNFIAENQRSDMTFETPESSPSSQAAEASIDSKRPLWANPTIVPSNMNSLPFDGQSGSLYKIRREPFPHDLQSQEEQNAFLSRLESWKAYNQREDRLRRHPGTCDWIFAQKTFQQWCQPSNCSPKTSILFIVGPSGCGKSVMTNHIAGVLDKFLNSGCLPFTSPGTRNETSLDQSLNKIATNVEYRDRTTVLKFFCGASRYKSRGQESSSNEPVSYSDSASPPIIEAFLYQLLNSQRHLCKSAQTLLTQDKLKSSSTDVQSSVNVASPAEVKRMFRKVIVEEAFGHLMLFIDGLDECGETFNKAILEYLHELVQDFCSAGESGDRSLKICISCQPIQSIPIWSCRHLTIHAQLDSIRQDISHFTRYEMDCIAYTRNLGLGIKTFATTLLKEYSGISFLWASLILAELRELAVVSETSLRLAITSFPTHLDQYYARALTRVNDASVRAVNRDSNPAWILLAILSSQEVLSIPELVELTAISETRPAHLDITRSANTDITSLIVRHLGSLVIVESNRAFIAHHSVRSFLDTIWSSPLLLEGKEVSFQTYSTSAHALMAEACLRYLMLEDFGLLNDSWYYYTIELDRKYIFLRYATLRLLFHLQGARDDLDNIEPLLRKFFDDKYRNYIIWERCYNIRLGRRITSSTTSVIGCLCKFNLEAVYARLFGNAEDRTVPTRWRAFAGRIQATLPWSYLPQSYFAETDVNRSIENLTTPDSLGNAPVFYAASNQDPSFLIHLETRGASLFAINHWGTALHCAAYNNSTACATHLLVRGLDIEARNFDGVTPLGLATLTGSSETVELLLSKGAEIEAQRRPLFLAARYGHEAVAIQLLARRPSLYVKTSEMETIVHLIAKYGLDALLKALLEIDPSLPLDEENKSGVRPVSLAAMGGFEPVLSTLLAHGAAVETEREVSCMRRVRNVNPEDCPETPLVLAVCYDRTSTALELLQRKATARFPEWHWWTLMHQAAITGNLRLCQALHEAGAEVDSQISDLTTPLWIAAVNGHYNVVAWLLSLQVRTDTIHRLGGTPLIHTASVGHPDIVLQLLKAGADPDATDDSNASALFVASHQRHAKVARYLLLFKPKLDLETSDGGTALSVAVRNGDQEMVTLLLEAGASPDPARDERSDRPIHQAVFDNNLEILGHLLDAGASLNVLNKSGETPLSLACRQGHVELMEQIYGRLGEKEQESSAINSEGGSLYHEVARNGKTLPLVKLLALVGPHGLDQPNSFGWTPFCTACRYGTVESLTWFVDQNVDIHRVYPDGTSAFHHAVISGDLMKVRLLIKHGVSISARDKNDDSGLDCACDLGYASIVKEIIRCGGDITHRNKFKGYTALHEAVVNGNFECVDLLVRAGAPLECLDVYLDTPLDNAICLFNRPIVAYLTHSNANWEMLRGRGLTPFELSMKANHGISPRRLRHLDSKSKHKLIELINETMISDHRDRRTLKQLAELLTRLGDYQNASQLYLVLAYTSRELAPENVNDQTPLKHEFCCDACNELIEGKRFKCTVCDDFDLCLACYKSFDNATALRLSCSGHPFLHIPGTDPDSPLRRQNPEEYNVKFWAKFEAIKSKYQSMDVDTALVEDKEDQSDPDLDFKYEFSPFVLRCSGVSLFEKGAINLRGPHGLPHYQSRSLWQSHEAEVEYKKWAFDRQSSGDEPPSPEQDEEWDSESYDSFVDDEDDAISIE